jgi:hypothetical protein
MSLRDVDTQSARYDFLIADSFVTRAEFKLAAGELDAAKNLMGKAEARYAAVQRPFRTLENNDERNEIQGKVEPASGEVGRTIRQAAQSCRFKLNHALNSPDPKQGGRSATAASTSPSA